MDFCDIFMRFLITLWGLILVVLSVTLIYVFVSLAHGATVDSKILETCRQKYNVHDCELVAVPKKGAKQ